MGVTDYDLWQLVQRHKGTPAGLAIWLAWEMDVPLSHLVGLTWENLPSPLPLALARAIEALPPPHEGPLLKTRRGTAFTAPYLSRLTGELLCREGLRGVTLRSLRPHLRFDQVSEVLRLAVEQGVTPGEVAAGLGIPKTQADKGLKALAERGRLCRRGHRYFLPESG